MPCRSSTKISTAEKLIYIAGNSKDSTTIDFQVFLDTLDSQAEEEED